MLGLGGFVLVVPEQIRGLREISLFSGVGGGVLGSRLLGWETVAYVEWDDFAKKVLKARIEDGSIHDAPIFSDAQKFDGAAWQGKADVISAGFPCFVAGTMVLTREGHRPIEEIRVGDEVLTHLGRWRPVTSTMFRENAPLREIRAQGVPGIVGTDEHPFYSRLRDQVWDNGRRRYIRRFGDVNWVEAENITRNHFLSQALPSRLRTSISSRTWRTPILKMRKERLCQNSST